MINLKVDKYYELDLYEDVIMNEDKKLYQFLDNDPVKSYYFGKNIKSWKDSLNDRQVYLYSKDLRRVDINIEKYIEQIKFWGSKLDPEEVVNIIEFHQYLLNNMFYLKDEDVLLVAIYLGETYNEIKGV